MATILTVAEAQTALCRDHVNGRHGRPWAGCPVCAYVRSNPMPEWKRRRLEASQGRIVACVDTTGAVAL
jgi:hypothetical protein